MKINTFTPEVSLDVDYSNNTNFENIDENNIFLSLLESINEEIAGEFELESFDLDFDDEDNKDQLTEADDSTENLEAMLFGLPPLLQQLSADINDSLQQSSGEKQQLLENNNLSSINANLPNFSADLSIAAEDAADSINPTTTKANELFSSQPTLATTNITDNNLGINDNNKFNQIFSQVGQFINSYTIPVAQSAATNEAATNIPINSNSANYQIQIERLPTNNQLLDDIVTANIKIYPPELGPVLAKINIQDQTANLLLITQSHAVKHIIESNLAQLHEQFKNSDMSVNNIKVEVESRGSNSSNQSAHEGQERNAQAEQSTTNDLETESQDASIAKTNVKTSSSIIDTFI